MGGNCRQAPGPCAAMQEVCRVVIIFALTVIGGLGLLGLAVWPGVLEDAVFGIPFCFLSLPLHVSIRMVWLPVSRMKLCKLR